MWFKICFQWILTKRFHSTYQLLSGLTGILYQTDKSTCIFCSEDILNNTKPNAKMMSKPV